MTVNKKILTWLETELFEGRLELGQNLPNDRKLANIIHASHSSTREALKQLEIMGVLRLYEGKRKTIIARLIAEPFSSATPALRLHMASSRHPMRDMVQTRILLESWAVSQADPAHPAMEELEATLASMQREGILPQEFHQFEVNFHIGLTKLAGNQLITGLMTSMRDAMYENMLSIMGKVPLWSATAIRLRAEHRAILAAIQNGDNETARQLVVATIENQYAEAEIDLDEATEVANELPGTVPSLAPVEVEQDDLIPEEWEEAVSPQVIEALENIGAPTSMTDFTENKQEFPAGQWATAAEKTEQNNTIESTVRPSPPLQSSHKQHRRGVVSSPVYATVIKPINRTPGEVTPVISGKLTETAPTQEPETTSKEEVALDAEAAEKERLARIAALTAPTGPEPAVKTPHEQDFSPQEEVVQDEPAGQVDGKSGKRTRRLGKWLGFSREETSARRKSHKDPQGATEDEKSPEADLSEEAEADQAPEGYEYADRAYAAPEVIDETGDEAYLQDSAEDSLIESEAEIQPAEKQKVLGSKKKSRKKKRKR